jgi:hypothetical protein
MQSRMAQRYGTLMSSDGVHLAEAAQMILINHQRHRGCLCGWSELGACLAAHQVAKLREAGLINEDPHQAHPA